MSDQPTPKRLRRRRTPDWRLPIDARYVGRPTKWGNPFKVGEPVEVTALSDPEFGFAVEVTSTADMAVALYRGLWEIRCSEEGLEHPEDIETAREYQADIDELRGRDLVCWCPLDQPCHADVLLELANR